MADRSEGARDRAEARFAKAKKDAEEGAKATAQYTAENRATHGRISQLKALRLAREQEELEKAPPPAKRAAKRRAK